MKCLEKTVECRYENMGNLAEDLQRFMEGGQVHALSETSPSSQQVYAEQEPQESPQNDAPTRSTTLQAGATKTKSWWQFWK
jgi:hypothetical protein